MNDIPRDEWLRLLIRQVQADQMIAAQFAAYDKAQKFVEQQKRQTDEPLVSRETAEWLHRWFEMEPKTR